MVVLGLLCRPSDYKHGAGWTDTCEEAVPGVRWDLTARKRSFGTCFLVVLPLLPLCAPPATWKRTYRCLALLQMHLELFKTIVQVA